MFKLVLTREDKSATFEQVFDDYLTLSNKMTKLSHLFDNYFIYNLQTVNQNPIKGALNAFSNAISN